MLQPALFASRPVESVGLSLAGRAACYARAFPKWPPLVVTPDDRWLYGTWMIGNDYRGSGYYGAYPPTYLRRVAALFPDLWGPRMLHLFSGSLAPDVPGVRVDVNPTLRPTVIAQATALPFAAGSVRLTCADPPYSKEDAKRYGVRMVDRRAVFRELARVTMPGGFVVWLDCTYPQYRKAEWRMVGTIGLWRSTNHRIRGVMLYERQ